MGVFGSLTNRIMESRRPIKAEIGDGATITMWSDRLAGTVVETTVFKSGERKGQLRTITVRRDRARNLLVWPAQEYEYTPDPNGPERVFTVNAQGVFRCGSDGLVVGKRDEYQDPNI